MVARSDLQRKCRKTKPPTFNPALVLPHGNGSTGDASSSDSKAAVTIPDDDDDEPVIVSLKRSNTGGVRDRSRQVKRNRMCGHDQRHRPLHARFTAVADLRRFGLAKSHPWTQLQP